MKKRFVRLFAATVASGLIFTGAYAGAVPVAVFADEAADDEGIQETYRITTEAIEWVSKNPVSSDDFVRLGRVTVDKTEAKSGEKVTVKLEDGTEASFWPRFYIERISDGEEVTEELLGERERHDWSGESFIMPEYDIKIYAFISEGSWDSVPPPFVVMEGQEVYELHIEQTQGGTIFVENTQELVVFGNDVPASTYGIPVSAYYPFIKMKAVPEPGYRFEKWYVKGSGMGVGITDDILKETTFETGDDYISVAHSTFDRRNDLTIHAVFEETEPHNISIEKRFDDIVAEIDKTTARVGEKVHLKVDTGESAQEPDLGLIIIKRADNGEELQRIDGFLGHDHFWEGDISMPDTDIAIEIASGKWEPAVPNLDDIKPKWATEITSSFNVKFKDSEGKDLTKDVSYEVSSKINDEKWEAAGEIVSFDKNESRIDHTYKSVGGNLQHDMINSYIKINSVPEGYKLPADFVLSSAAKDGIINELDVSVSDKSISVIKADANGLNYDVIVTLEKATTVDNGSKAAGNVSNVAATQVQTSAPTAYASAASPSASKAPATGDSDKSALWVAAGITAAAAGTVSLIKLRKQRKEEK